MCVVIAICRCCVRKGWEETPSGMTDDRFDYNSGAVGEFTDHLMSRNERETYEVLKVCGGLPFNQR
jgi:hypothetical protein